VVALRLGLPLLYTDIIEHMGRSGRTRLDHRRLKGMGDTLERRAVMAAAGIVAEGGLRRAPISLPPGNPTYGDACTLLEIACQLRIVARSDHEPEFDPIFYVWAKAGVARARSLLRRGRGAAWRRVTAALLREHRLSGRNVQALVAEADKESDYRPQSL
jgi:hypothetical protein